MKNQFLWATRISVIYIILSLNPDRMSLSFNNSGPLSDKIADTPYEMQKGGIISGKGFGTITEIQVGPDGNLYVLNLFGDLYRISSVSAQKDEN